MAASGRAAGIDFVAILFALGLTGWFAAWLTGLPVIRLVRRNIDTVLASFERAKVKIALENHDWASLEKIVRLIDEWGPDRAGFCLDTVNSLGFRDGLVGVIELLGAKDTTLHGQKLHAALGQRLPVARHTGKHRCIGLEGVTLRVPALPGHV